MSETSRKILGVLTFAPGLLATTEELSSGLFYGRERRVFESISKIWEESKPNTIDIQLLAEMLGGEQPVTYVTNLLKSDEIDLIEPVKFRALVTSAVAKMNDLSGAIRARVQYTTGDFTTNQLYSEFGATSVTEKAAIRQVLHRMKEAGEIIPTSKKDGIYRKVDRELEEVDLLGTPPTPVDLVLPLGLSDMVKIYPRSIVVFAGAGNRGKTSLAYHFIKENMGNHEIRLLFSEGGEESLIDRLTAHEDKRISDWKVKAYPRTRNFEDVILPNGVTVIDYMLIPDEFWMVGRYLDDIYRQLERGVVYVNIQKDTKAEIGRGGEFGLERPQLYVTLNPDYDIVDREPNDQYVIAKILKAKAWKRGNPDGKVMKFVIENGWKIKHWNDWHYPPKEMPKQQKTWKW